MSIVHVYPTDDAIEHIESLDCPCRPTFYEAGEHHPEIPVPLVGHNPVDGVKADRQWLAVLHKLKP